MFSFSRLRSIVYWVLRVEVGNCFHPFLEEMKTLSIVTITAMILLQQVIAAKHNHVTTMTTSEESIAPKLSEHKPTEREIKNFWRKVDKNGPVPDQSVPQYKGLDQCWIWTGSVCSGGYGTFWCGKKVRGAHRVALLIQTGSLVEDLETIHICDNRRCVRHLIQGTTTDNIRDCLSKGRHVAPKGEKCLLARLTESQVLEIRAKYAAKEATQVQLAAQYGIVQSGISSILRRETWKHI